MARGGPDRVEVNVRDLEARAGHNRPRPAAGADGEMQGPARAIRSGHWGDPSAPV